MKNTLLPLISGILLLSSCSVIKHKDLVYKASDHQKLNIFQPKKTTELAPVLVFIHGGNWNSGSKDTYSFFGKGMAKKGVVAVTIDYRLAPQTKYDGMALDAATAVEWVKNNIKNYGGDPNKIYVSGHSAGGHLAALISTDTTYYNKLGTTDPAKGTILIDAFGLDMFAYMEKKQFEYDTNYLPTFTTNPENWKAGSPINYLHAGMPPTLLFVGTKTYKSIIIDSYNYWDQLRKYQPDVQMIQVKGKRHAGMILRFANPYTVAYEQIFGFMGIR